VIVVAHTPVLLNLCCIGQAKLLNSLFREVVIPPEVAADFRRLVSETPRFEGLALPRGLRQQPATAIPNLVRCARGLDPAAPEVLALAAEIKAGAILVEKRRIHEVALQLGLRAGGVLGILSQAKTKGLLPRIAPLLEQLETKAGFKIAPVLRARVLRDAGEAK
jgi:predicted nucleic acid-binding protein